jgi:hypothetical protein
MDALNEMIEQEETRHIPKDNDRIFEKTVKINRKYIATIHIRNQPGDDLLVRDRLAELQNVYGMGIQDLVNLAFVRGLELLEKEVLTKDIDEFDKTVIKAYMNNSERRQQFGRFDIIYRETSPEEFEKICKDQPFYYDYLQERVWQNEAISSAKRRLQWLREFMYENGRNGECKLDVIKVAAEGDGIIRDENDWNALKTMASRYGMSGGKHGYWQWTPKAQLKYQNVDIEE